MHFKKLKSAYLKILKYILGYFKNTIFFWKSSSFNETFQRFVNSELKLCIVNFSVCASNLKPSASFRPQPMLVAVYEQRSPFDVNWLSLKY